MIQSVEGDTQKSCFASFAAMDSVSVQYVPLKLAAATCGVASAGAI